MVTDLLLKSHRKKINNHKWVLLSCIDENIQKYENILMGDYNAKVSESNVQEFCESYVLGNETSIMKLS